MSAQGEGMFNINKVMMVMMLTPGCCLSYSLTGPTSGLFYR